MPDKYVTSIYTVRAKKIYEYYRYSKVTHEIIIIIIYIYNMEYECIKRDDC